MLQKNQTVELVIDDIANDGSGVGRADGLAVFVPNTAAGDRISAKIVKATPRLAYGVVQELLSPGPGPQQRRLLRMSRLPPLRKLLAAPSDLRGGAARQGTLVSENLRRIGGIDLPAPPCLPSPASDRYRNKAIYPIRMQNGEPVLGFYAKRSHRVEPVDDCLLHPEVFSALCRAALGWIHRHRISVYDEETHTGLIRSLYLRQAEATGEVMAMHDCQRPFHSRRGSADRGAARRLPPDRFDHSQREHRPHQRPARPGVPYPLGEGFHYRPALRSFF